jgi:hypothetical protein
VFSGSVYIGIMLAYFASWGSSLHIDKNSYNSWVVPTSIHLMFAGIIFILSWFNNESPRFLVKKGNPELAITNLAKIRGLPTDDEYVVNEINGIKHQLAEEQEATMGQGFLGCKSAFVPKASFGERPLTYCSRPSRNVLHAQQLLPHLPWPRDTAARPMVRRSEYHHRKYQSSLA